MQHKVTVREIGINEDRRAMMFFSGFEIVAEDGRTLYDVRVSEDGTLEVSAGGTVKQAGRVLDSQLMVRPHSTNVITIMREEYGGND